MTEITINLNTETIKVNDYAFEIAVIGCLIGICCAASSIAFYLHQIGLGLVLMIIMLSLALLWVYFFSKQRKLVLDAALEHKLLERYKVKYDKGDVNE